MKKFIALILSLVLFVSLAVSVYAAGADDGSITVADKNGKKYFGTVLNDAVDKYEIADGSGDFYFDLTGDKTMNICDLVKTVEVKADVNADDAHTSDDAALIRTMLIK